MREPSKEYLLGGPCAGKHFALTLNPKPVPDSCAAEGSQASSRVYTLLYPHGFGSRLEGSGFGVQCLVESAGCISCRVQKIQGVGRDFVRFLDTSIEEAKRDPTAPVANARRVP